MSDRKIWFNRRNIGSDSMLKSIAGAVLGEVIGRKRGHGLLGAGIGLVATRVASRSIPGLLFIGGAIAAKSIYDKRKNRS